LTLNEYIESIKNQSIAILGYGVSNKPLVELLLNNGCNITVCDRRSAEQMGEEAEYLKSRSAKLRLGEDYLENLTEDIIFRTPGLMPFDEHLAAAAERGSIITSEMEVFFKLCPCRTIAITGSDGKTTTSTIISELLKAAGYRVHLGGNIGKPLLNEIDDIRPSDIAVLELSSFQLHSMYCKPNIAVITNVSPNHLDKHKDFQDYIDAKREIFANQDENDRLILNLDDEHSEYYASQAKSSIAFFSKGTQPRDGTFCCSGVLCRMRAWDCHGIMDADAIKLPGEHNMLNYLTAFAAVDGLVSDDVCRKVAMEFAGVEHRLELVRTVNGVKFINDSIGTSPTRTIAGLRALKEKPIVIAGGYDKHIPFDTLGDELCLRAKRVFLTGDTAELIKAAILNSKHYAESEIELVVEDDFKTAVLSAAESASEGDTVLLSPACAAFDRFKNFVERGNYFKQIVMEL